MAYKKYFYRNGRKFGPYYYESYRDENGAIKKRYVGKDHLDVGVTPTKFVLNKIVLILLICLNLVSHLE